MEQAITLRIIEQEDNADLAKIIRDTLAEFGANHPGTVYYDSATDHLFELLTCMVRSSKPVYSSL